MKQAVSLNANQKPMYGLLHGVGGEPDGSFVFFRHGTESLDAALQEKMKRIGELEKLDKEAAEKLRRQQDEIAAKQGQMNSLDKRLAELQAKVGTTGGQSDLDTMLVMLQEKEEKAQELERLRQKAETELREKEETLVEEKRKQEEEHQKQFEDDYAKFFQIAKSQYATEDLKAEAWRVLCRDWNISDTIEIGAPLIFTGGKVQSSPQNIEIDGITFQMVLIPGGMFRMGNIHGSGLNNEESVHTVTLSSFQMSMYEVTQGQYKLIMGTNRSSYNKGDDHPVENVSWFNVVRFCNRLSDRAGLESCYNEETWECDFTKKGFRLPTEAEWEYACIAGTTTIYYTGNSESDLTRSGWYKGNSDRKTHKVGQKAPNNWDLYDMHGNVWEWCNDWFGYYSSDSQNDPVGPLRGTRRVARGGGWGNNAVDCRSSVRGSDSPSFSHAGLGFRIVRRP